MKPTGAEFRTLGLERASGIKWYVSGMSYETRLKEPKHTWLSRRSPLQGIEEHYKVTFTILSNRLTRALVFTFPYLFFYFLYLV